MGDKRFLMPKRRRGSNRSEDPILKKRYRKIIPVENPDDGKKQPKQSIEEEEEEEIKFDDVVDEDLLRKEREKKENAKILRSILGDKAIKPQENENELDIKRFSAKLVKGLPLLKVIAESADTTPLYLSHFSKPLNSIRPSLEEVKDGKVTAKDESLKDRLSEKFGIPSQLDEQSVLLNDEKSKKEYKLNRDLKKKREQVTEDGTIIRLEERTLSHLPRLRKSPLTFHSRPVSYTHLTLPTIYSV
eukprot:TRINITY_DN16596_c0_g1_i2.p1 TRINITY_DN16596_c0_g1~~TRINITY_DN16596_c0_g1_i2.p1  ORF type:complete len:245 (-),score=68.59 TRINITY_DN16596_c0_g1_i2:34-768(-)